MGQILHAAIADVSFFAKDEAITSRQVLERSLATRPAKMVRNIMKK